MRFEMKLAASGGVAAFVALALFGCGDERPPVLEPPGKPPPTDASVSDAARDAGAIDVVPDTACAMRGAGTPVPGLAAAPLEGLGVAGTRWVASLVSGEGFVTFEGDGMNLAGPIRLATFDRAAGRGSNVSVTGYDGAGVLVGIFGPTGMPVGAPARITTDVPKAIGTGTSPNTTVALWAMEDAVRARIVDASGKPTGADSLTLESGTLVDSVSLTAAPLPGTAPKFLVVWGEHRVEQNRWVAQTAVVGDSNVAVAAATIFSSQAPVRVVGTVRTFDDTFAILLDQDGSSLLLRVNAQGKLSQVGKLFDGNVKPLAVATRAGETAIMGLRPDRSIAFRSLDVAANPISDWVCFEAVDPQVEAGATLAASSATQYTLLFTGKDGAPRIARIDRTGK
jgi:hypothetical protein